MRKQQYDCQLPASITTDVVPSPTSASWLLAISTNVFAAGCTISSSWKWTNWYIKYECMLLIYFFRMKPGPFMRHITFMIVAPSFEIVAFPLLSTISLSIPLGPSVVLIASTIAWHAFIFEMTCCFPWAFSVPSFNTSIWGCIFVNWLSRWNVEDVIQIV